MTSSFTKCYCLIPHPLQTSILVHPVDGRYECPSVQLPEQRLKFFPDHVPHIRQVLRRKTNLEMTVLRHLKDSENVQICLMEVHSDADYVIEGYLWLDSREEVNWVDEHSFQAWQSWLSLAETQSAAAALAPWEQKGWFADAALWMKTRLHEAGYESSEPVEQLKGAWGWSSLLKTVTDKGDVYFKADYHRPPKEAAVILKLEEQWPRNVPYLIAEERERSWMLMSDFGGVSLERLETDDYVQAVFKYAQIQRLAAPHSVEWRLLGCPDMTPAAILRQTPHLLADTALLSGGDDGLRGEELAALQLQVPQIEQMLICLASSALPNTISNEDFKAGNVVVCGGQPVFYDWSSTVISHPFFGINYFLNRVPRSGSEDGFRWRNDLEDMRRCMILSVFLSEWIDFADRSRLLSEFWLCRRLYHLYELVKCANDLPFVGTTSPWGAASLAYLPQAARKLIAALNYQPLNPGIITNIKV